MSTCCNPKHKTPVPAEYVIEDRRSKAHFLCDECAWILDNLGNCDTFIEEIGEWESEHMTLEERIEEARGAAADYYYEKFMDA